MGMLHCTPSSALHHGDTSPTFFQVSGGLRNWAFRGVSSLLKRLLGSLALMVTEKMLLFALVAIAMLLGTCRALALRWERESLLLVPLTFLGEKQLPPFATWGCPGRLIIPTQDYICTVIRKASYNEDAMLFLYNLQLHKCSSQQAVGYYEASWGPTLAVSTERAWRGQEVFVSSGRGLLWPAGMLQSDSD